MTNLFLSFIQGPSTFFMVLASNPLSKTFRYGIVAGTLAFLCLQGFQAYLYLNDLTLIEASHTKSNCELHEGCLAMKSRVRNHQKISPGCDEFELACEQPAFNRAFRKWIHSAPTLGDLTTGLQNQLGFVCTLLSGLYVLYLVIAQVIYCCRPWVEGKRVKELKRHVVHQNVVD